MTSATGSATAGVRSGLIAGTVLDGVELRALKMNRDARGSFTEVFQEHWGTCIRPVQWSVVQSDANVFRGVHLHRRHDEYVCALSGRMLVGLRDLRPWSPTLDRWSLYELVGEDLACITFPAGLLHGWYFPEAATHLQAVSEAYLDYGRDDNWGCHWSDPALEIPWPIAGQPTVATRAQDFPTLAALCAALGEWGPPAADAGLNPAPRAP